MITCDSAIAATDKNSSTTIHSSVSRSWTSGLQLLNKMDQGIKLTAAALFLLTVCSTLAAAQSGVCKFLGSYSIGLAVSSI